jgi:hypothetical protein
MAADPNDWRLTNQADYLHGCVWTWKPYKRYRADWEHDHCEFCHAKFMEPGTPDTLHEGYSTQDNYRCLGLGFGFGLRRRCPFPPRARCRMIFA